MRTVTAAWTPLALSWALMGIEQPAIAAVIARLPDPEVQLAAYGGVVFPLALVIEAPVIMLLAASTELSRDRAAYAALRRFSHRLGLAMTLLHLLIAVTPAYDFVVVGLLAVPADVVEPARLGLLLLTPWTWAIAWRRFNQGVLIRAGRSRVVTFGTALRLMTSGGLLAGGLAHPAWSGVVVGSVALTAGVFAEAVYAAIAVRGTAARLPAGDPADPPLRGRAFLSFYVPLASMPLVVLAIQPVGTAAISRMPDALASLAAWPTVASLLFVLQSVGLAFNEVVVATLGQPGARPVLARFAMILSVSTGAIVALLAFTPLSDVWFTGVAGLSDSLAVLAAGALWLGIPIPMSRPAQSYFQGRLVARRRTRGVTEAVILFALVCAGILGFGVVTQRFEGLEVALVAFSLGRLAEALWLGVRARREDRLVGPRDA